MLLLNSQRRVLQRPQFVEGRIGTHVRNALNNSVLPELRHKNTKQETRADYGAGRDKIISHFCSEGAGPTRLIDVQMQNCPDTDLQPSIEVLLVYEAQAPPKSHPCSLLSQELSKHR